MLIPALRSPRLPLACLAVAVLWYPLLMWFLGFAPFQAQDFGLAFNSMAEHLLSGRFDVDPDAIGAEGFTVGERSVAYFGIFCAVLRIPLVLWPGGARLDVTWWSCLGALCLAAFFQARAVSLAWRAGPETPRRGWLAAALLLCLLLGSPNIAFLRPSIYQEPISWGYAEAMGFLVLALRGLTLETGFDRRTLVLMALCAALALLTRVSFGIGLYAALGLLLLVRLRSLRERPGEWLAPGCVLLLGVLLTGLVNHGRWGNPLVFADYSLFNLSQDAAPGRLGRLAAYGAFHPARLWLGLGYYFLPVWIWLRADGHVLFAETQSVLMDSMELPPGSFFLSDPFLLVLAAAGLWTVRDRARAALSLGLSLPIGLMLCAISMAHRYRMEFYPLLIFAALLALTAPRREERAGPGLPGRGFRAAVVAGVVVSVLTAHAMAAIVARSPWGPGEFYLESQGLIETYRRAP